MKFLSLLSFLVIFSSVIAQTKKEIFIHRINEEVKVDGNLNETFWENAPAASDFVMMRPGAGSKEPANKKSIVKVVYDDNSIYFGAILFENQMDSVPKQIQGRDNFGNTDFFGVVLNPSNDGQNDFEFFVTFTGSQADAFVNPNIGEDFSWNAVWSSKVTYQENSWTVEMKIPYSAIRFSNQKEQIWGLNIHRNYRNTRHQYTWNFIDRTQGDIGKYHGLIKGIKGIEPPVRLSLFPFISGYYNNKSDDKFDSRLGLDLKYGLSENFTLDATLIPDFGQTSFDEEALNLGPFEQRFSEKRQFFTEGVELFNKGDLFYSRRVGAQPLGFYDVDDNLGDNDSIVFNPEIVKTLNAMKISGRTKGGLGIGFFNAITERTEAEIVDVNNPNSKRLEVTNPTSIYNVLVLEQQFKNNSTISYLNTSVLREGGFRDANVSSLRLNYFTKGQKYQIGGYLNYNYINQAKDINGFAGNLEFKKAAGTLQYTVGSTVKDDNYDVNDLGINFRNNTQDFYFNLDKIQFKPSKRLNSSRMYFRSQLNYRYDNGKYTGNYFEAGANATSLKFMTFGGSFESKLGVQRDYWEPRKDGLYFESGSDISLGGFISSDYRRRFALDMNVRLGQKTVQKYDPLYFRTVISPRFNINDHFTLVFRTTLFNNKGNFGFVRSLDDDIIFGKREINTVQNTITGNYNFNAFHGLSLSFRNYWSKVTYQSDDFFLLQNNGSVDQFDYVFDEDNNPDRNFNTWNMDLSYRWNFAPGSELIALYRNQLKTDNKDIDKNYFENVDALLSENIGHILSIRFVYYLDYFSLFSKKNKA